MALTATIYNLTVDLADIDRGVHEKLDVCIARQPSETIEYMFMRLIAYCLEYSATGLCSPRASQRATTPLYYSRPDRTRDGMDRGRYARPRALKSRLQARRPRSSPYSPRRS